MSHLTRQSTQHVRRVLFKRDPHCHWCRVLTVDPAKTSDHQRPDLATLDHIKSRMQCATKAEYRSGNNHVLACRKCNAERDRKFWVEDKPWQKPWRGKNLRTVIVPVPPELSAALDAALQP